MVLYLVHQTGDLFHRRVYKRKLWKMCTEENSLINCNQYVCLTEKSKQQAVFDLVINCNSCLSCLSLLVRSCNWEVTWRNKPFEQLSVIEWWPAQTVLQVFVPLCHDTHDLGLPDALHFD